ncbi:MAG: LuxR C-terminal-related transcriptional regulator [Acidimicrobiales bacterium]
MLRRSAGSIVGRIDDIREVRQALLAARLVTLLGPGGVGKTTLAAEVAREVEPEFDRVVLVELANAVDRGDLIRQVSRQVLSGPGQAGQSVANRELEIDRFVSALSVTSTLLVFDNCEHLVDDVARLTVTILDTDAEVRILATSRRPLEIAEEVLCTVRPLEVPAPGTGPGFSHLEADLTKSAAVQLFLERTRQAVPSFELSDANRSMVAQICAAADGVPLVLELAAALVRSRPLDQILLAMTEHPAELGAGRRDRAEHQRSLAASLDWSRQFLGEEDTKLLNRLSIFVGGFTAEAARIIDPAGTAEGLARLVDHSLVEFDPAIGRYYMLEVVRLDGVARLDQEELTAVEAAHTSACLGIVTDIELSRYDADPESIFPRYELELPNLTAALRRASACDDLTNFRALLGPIAVWWVHGMAPEDPAAWEAAFTEPIDDHKTDQLGSDDFPLMWRGNVLSALAFYWSHRGRHELALRYADDAATVHREADCLIELALDELIAGNSHQALDNRDAAAAAYNRGLELAVASGHPYPEMALRLVLATLFPDGPETAAHLTKAQSLAAAGFGAIEAAITTELALHALRTGRLAEAKKLSDLGLEKATTNGYSEVYASALCGRAEVAVVDGDLTKAGKLFQEALGIGRRTVHQGVTIRATEGLSSLPADWDRTESDTTSGDEVELSDRELAVARLLRGDLTQREIADELYIAPSTVKTHIKSIYRKLGVSKRSYAVTRAMELDLFD